MKNANFFVFFICQKVESKEVYGIENPTVELKEENVAA